MFQNIRPESVFTGWDFSTGAVKCLAFDVEGNVLAESHFPTELYTEEDGTIELSLLQLEGQARQTARDMAAKLRDLGRLGDWVAGGISATHHTSGRVDSQGNQIRRAICWNDQTLADYHAVGLKRLGGMERVYELLGGPWAIRYSLSHLVKDELRLSEADWRRTYRILSHGSLAAAYLTGDWNSISVSAAASTGMMDFRTHQWRREMLDALENPEYRQLAWEQLPPIRPWNVPLGKLRDVEGAEPWIFPTSDDQQAGLVGGGAVEDGQVAVILGNSAVVNSSCDHIPPADVNLDVMALSWGPYLLMRCYNNGAYFMDRVLGGKPDFARLETLARRVGPGAGGVRILPFLLAEPSLGVREPNLQWQDASGCPIPEPTDDGVRYRACLEALASLIAQGIDEHRRAGQKIRTITVSGGVAKSDLMCEILAKTLDFPLQRLESTEGPALGAAVTAMAGMEHCSVAQAAHQMVRYRPFVPGGQDGASV